MPSGNAIYPVEVDGTVHLESPVVKVKPSARIRPTAIAIPQQNPVPSPTLSSPSTPIVSVKPDQAQLIETTIQQCGNVTSIEGLSNLHKTISTLTEAVQSLQQNLTQIVTSQQQVQPQPSNCQFGEDFDPNKILAQGTPDIEPKKDLFKEQLERNLQKREAKRAQLSAPESVVAIPVPPPPPPPPPEPPSPAPSDGQLVPVEASQVPLEPPSDPRTSLSAELSQAVGGGLTLRKSKPIEKKETTEPKNEVDFRQLLKPASRKSILPDPQTLTAGPQLSPLVEDATKPNPLLEEIKRRKQERRKSMLAEHPVNFQEFTLSADVIAEQLKPVRLKKRDIALERGANEKDKPTETILVGKLKPSNKVNRQQQNIDDSKEKAADVPLWKATLKPVKEKPAWCRVSEEISVKFEEAVEENKENVLPILPSTPKAKPERIKPVIKIKPCPIVDHPEVEVSCQPVPPPPPPPQLLIPEQNPVPATRKVKEKEAMQDKNDNQADQNIEDQESSGNMCKGALLSAIREFKPDSLKTTQISTSPPAKASPEPNLSPNGHCSLLSEIKGFPRKKLKPVTKDEFPKKNSDPRSNPIRPSLNDMMESALKNRFRACNGEDDTDNESDNSDDIMDEEWAASEE